MITAERTVRADADRVWELMSRVGDWAELLPTVQRVSPRTVGGAPGVGARYALKQPGIPVLVYEVTAWDPGVGFTWVATSPGVRTIGTHTVTASPDGSVLRLTLGWAGPLARIVERLYASRTDRYVQQEADTFARLAERAGPA